VHDVEPHAWRGDERALLADVAIRVFNRIDRARAETALRRSEERQAFLVRLGDELRALDEPEAIVAATIRLGAEQLAAGRAYYVEIEAGAPSGGARTIVKAGLPGAAGPGSVPSLAGLAGRRTIVVPDVSSSGLPPDDRAAFAALGVGACILVPLVGAK